MTEDRAKEFEAAREYHARRTAAKREEREALRQEKLAQARAAIRKLAPQFPSIAAVYLFGSIVRPGRFTHRSDIDVAVVCEDVATESDFWRALEKALEWNVDVRPNQDAIVRAVETQGKRVYERKVSDFGTEHPE